MPSKWAAWYQSTRWRKSRKAFLSANPLCSECRKYERVTVATIVDHIEPHKGDEDKFWDQSNWQGLCASCHSMHKQSAERGHGQYGCDASGRPLDPSHPWYEGGGGSNLWRFPS